ncbi:MAG: hypothetical protein AAFP19_23500 [Bacteroidota bacterium]
MRPLITITLLFFLINSLSAQLGANAGIKRMNAPEWEAIFEGESFLDQGFKVGVDYWFRLKNRRIEFTPELSYSRFASTIDHFTEGNAQDFSSTQLGFHFNTNIYILDLGEDCDCPTFDKDGTILDKGLFVQVSPGLSLFQNRYEGLEEVKSNDTVFSLGIGLGLDIGLTNFVTLTPLISFHRFFNAEWEDLILLATDGREISGDAGETTSPNQFFAGLKLGFRFDQIRGY